MAEIAERVAKACGFKFGRVIWRDSADGDSWQGFNPEEIAADAVLAAEKYGLLASDAISLKLIDRSGARVWDVIKDDGEASFDIIGSGTFCEAVCQVILHLEEQRKPSDGEVGT